MPDDLLAPLLRYVLLTLVTLAIGALAAQMIRRPRRHRDHPHRRLMPRWFTAVAAGFLLLSVPLGLAGLAAWPDAVSAADLEDARGMTFTGLGMLVLGLFFLWVRLSVYLEATPTGFVFRGVTLRAATILYDEIRDIGTITQRGAPRVTIAGPGRKKFTVALGMIDWTFFDQWKTRRIEQARLHAEQVAAAQRSREEQEWQDWDGPAAIGPADGDPTGWTSSDGDSADERPADGGPPRER